MPDKFTRYSFKLEKNQKIKKIVRFMKFKKVDYKNFNKVTNIKTFYRLSFESSSKND